jgi:CarD family transcriptional regulator
VFKIGEKVVYPSHGVGTIEKIENKQDGIHNLSFYALRLSLNNTLIFVPTKNARDIGLRPPISAAEGKLLMNNLSDDFIDVIYEWKSRFRDFSEKMKGSDIFAIADVLKKLTYLNNLKPLSFREQRMLEKARYLVTSELATVLAQPESQMEIKVLQAVTCSCEKHRQTLQPKEVARVAAGH